jgi:hypothetical protein
MSFRLVRNLSLFSEGFPTRFACGNDSLEPKIDFAIGSTVCYAAVFLRRMIAMPASPKRPMPRRRIVEGSGTTRAM